MGLFFILTNPKDILPFCTVFEMAVRWGEGQKARTVILHVPGLSVRKVRTPKMGPIVHVQFSGVLKVGSMFFQTARCSGNALRRDAQRRVFRRDSRHSHLMEPSVRKLEPGTYKLILQRFEVK